MSPPPPGEPASPVAAVDVEGQMLAIAFKPMPLLMLLTALAPSLIALIWWSLLPRSLLLVWCAAGMVCVVAGYVLWRSYLAATHTATGHTRWQRAYFKLAVFAGLVWGLGPCLLIPSALDTPLLSLFVGLVLAVCGVATSTLAAQPRALRWMMIVTLLLPAISAWRLGSTIGQLAALTMLAGLALLLMTARHTSASVLSLVSTQARLRSILDSSHDAVIEVDEHGLIRGWNPQASRLFAWSAQEVMGRDFVDTVLDTQDATGGRLRLAPPDGEPATVTYEELTAVRRDGSRFPAEVVVAPLRIQGGFQYTVFMADISARKQAEELVRQQAMLDPLTGLPNRRLLNARLLQAQSNALRHQRPGALMYIDLDRFKDINDSLGHEAGDELLKAVAGRLREVTREGDTAARIGGDEFIVMLENLHPSPQDAAAQATEVGSKLLQVLNVPFQLAGREVHNTPSIGVALFGLAHEDADSVLRRADTALYEAKRAGRNCLRIFTPDGQPASASLSAVASSAV